MNPYKFVRVWIWCCFINRHTAATRYSNLETRYITKVTIPRAEKLPTCAISFVKFVFVSCIHIASWAGWLMVSFFWAKIWHRLIPYTCLQNLSPREHFATNDRELAWTLKKKKRKKKTLETLRAIPSTWFIPHTHRSVDFLRVKRVTGLTDESRPNTGPFN